ncbi:CPBP family intramembrane metalloprotease [Bifidobacterium sp. LC6]|uniref:CPBP family intramembrane metalloprotease n=2 Tax=Bifidobacterium colobi TaxID=2809026 RepID=A0ABS5UX23_9BIFI|nr:CPBP family intramembrane metalloprotease [Bifidobacterium colobi]
MVSPRQAWKTWRRRVVNRAMGLAFIYESLMYVGGFALMIFVELFSLRWLDGPDGGEGFISLAGVAAAMGFLLIMRHRDILTREFWLGGPHTDTYGEPNQLGRISQYGGGRMRPQWFLVFIMLGMGVQSIVSLAQIGLALIGGGLSSPTSEAISDSSNTVSMWLYVGVAAPICEEVIFRGVLMKELKPLGKNFAIVTSAFAFGLFHDDFVQGTFAFLFGLILGFVAMEYSLVWSIALHAFNNAILSGVIDTWFAGQLNDTQYTVYVIVLTAVGVIGATVALAVYGRGLKQYRMQNRSIPDTYAGWSSPVFIAFVVANILLTIVLLVLYVA